MTQIAIKHNQIDYKFREKSLVDELQYYIDKTYAGHYGGSIQPAEAIISAGFGTGFILGDIIKYAMRYGKKGPVEDHRKDLMKIAHYAILALYNHDVENERTPNETK